MRPRMLARATLVATTALIISATMANQATAEPASTADGAVAVTRVAIQSHHLVAAPGETLFSRTYFTSLRPDILNLTGSPRESAGFSIDDVLLVSVTSAKGTTRQREWDYSNNCTAMAVTSV